MPRYIDADDLRDKVLNDNTYDNDTVNYYLGLIDNAPTIDPVKRGKWERIVNAYGELEGFACEFGIGPGEVGILFVDMAGYSAWNRRAEQKGARGDV